MEFISLLVEAKLFAVAFVEAWASGKVLETGAEIFWGQAAASHDMSSRGGPELRIQPLSTISHPLGWEDVGNPLHLPVWSTQDLPWL